MLVQTGVGKRDELGSTKGGHTQSSQLSEWCPRAVASRKRQSELLDIYYGREPETAIAGFKMAERTHFCHSFHLPKSTVAALIHRSSKNQIVL